MGRPARYNATLDLVPYAKSQCGGWNATAHARRFFHSVSRPMGRERAKRSRILSTGTFVDRRWGCDKHTCAAFCHDDCAVRSANPFNAGVARRRSRCGMAWVNQLIVSWKGTSVPGFSTVASTNAGNHAIVLLLNDPNAHPPHLMSPTVLVGRAPPHRLPPLRDLSIAGPALPHSHSSLKGRYDKLYSLSGNIIVHSHKGQMDFVTR